MSRDLEMKESWMCAVYLHSMCRQVQIFPIMINRKLKTLVNKLKGDCNISKSVSDEFTLTVERNEFHPNEDQIKYCAVFIKELSRFSSSGIDNLFLEYANQRINEDRSRIRNNKIDGLGI